MPGDKEMHRHAGCWGINNSHRHVRGSRADFRHHETQLDPKGQETTNERGAKDWGRTVSKSATVPPLLKSLMELAESVSQSNKFLVFRSKGGSLFPWPLTFLHLSPQKSDIYLLGVCNLSRLSYSERKSLVCGTAGWLWVLQEFTLWIRRDGDINNMVAKILDKRKADNKCTANLALRGCTRLLMLAC